MSLSHGRLRNEKQVMARTLAEGAANSDFIRPACAAYAAASARSSARHCAGDMPNSDANQREKELGVA
jgi:hypothetical protein